MPSLRRRRCTKSSRNQTKGHGPAARNDIGNPQIHARNEVGTGGLTARNHIGTQRGAARNQVGICESVPHWSAGRSGGCPIGETVRLPDTKNPVRTGTENMISISTLHEFRRRTRPAERKMRHRRRPCCAGREGDAAARSGAGRTIPGALHPLRRRNADPKTAGARGPDPRGDGGRVPPYRVRLAAGALRFCCAGPVLLSPGPLTGRDGGRVPPYRVRSAADARAGALRFVAQSQSRFRRGRWSAVGALRFCRAGQSCFRRGRRAGREVCRLAAEVGALLRKSTQAGGDRPASAQKSLLNKVAFIKDLCYSKDYKREKNALGRPRICGAAVPWRI